MILEKDVNLINDLKRLSKLKELMSSDIHMAENNDEPDGMTIDDLEEWLKEINSELSEFRKKKPADIWLKDKYFSKFNQKRRTPVS
ncbi:MAG: hypothetical protein V1904_06370 [Bacteroidota bacterium]